jgi:hypothetical protein
MISYCIDQDIYLSDDALPDELRLFFHFALMTDKNKV